MRAPGKWTEEDLQRLASDGTGESLQLEFKSCGALTKDPKDKKEIGKDISAMANSAGGTIIYGIIEKDHVAEKVDAGFNQRIITKEWLEQVIDSNVQPRIEGLVITVVPLSSGLVAFVVDIPQAASRAPHQAADRRYYKRANFTNQMMEDYEVRDILRRSQVPDLHLEWEPTSGGKAKLTEGSPVEALFGLSATVRNASTEPAYYSVVSIYFDESLTVLHSGEFTKGEAKEIDGCRTISYWQAMSPVGHFPFIKEQDIGIGEFRCSTSALPALQTFRIISDLRTPGCIRKQAWELAYRNGTISITLLSEV